MYLIFNPNFDTNFSNQNIHAFQSKILEEYNETLVEIDSFGDFKWLFEAVMDYQSEHLGLTKPKLSFDFSQLDQRTYSIC